MVVDYDNIDLKGPDAGGGSVYFYKGQPFTGTVVEYIDGVLIGEVSVVNSHTQGRVTHYHSNGQLKQEYFEKRNRIYGIYKRWNINGILETEIDYGSEPE